MRLARTDLQQSRVLRSSRLLLVNGQGLDRLLKPRFAHLLSSSSSSSSNHDSPTLCSSDRSASTLPAVMAMTASKCLEPLSFSFFQHLSATLSASLQAYRTVPSDTRRCTGMVSCPRVLSNQSLTLYRPPEDLGILHRSKESSAILRVTSKSPLAISNAPGSYPNAYSLAKHTLPSSFTHHGWVLTCLVTGTFGHKEMYRQGPPTCTPVEAVADRT